jgi:hypothetical protein
MRGLRIGGLQSANGSNINGLTRLTVVQKLKDGDRIHAGETILVSPKHATSRDPLAKASTCSLLPA